MNRRTILIYGRSGAGKTAQIGALAEHILKTTGKRTRLYTVDKGGLDTIRPYVELGVIDPIELDGGDPWVFLNKAVRGHVKDANGKWVIDAARNADIGMYAFESLRAVAEELKQSMIQKVRSGINIGGGANISFTANDVASGESLKISGGNMAIFGAAQERVVEELWQSFNLDAPIILWTSSVSKDEDTNASGKVLGPDVIGKALTTEVPRWFNLTYRMDVAPAKDGKPERHILYLGTHVDINAGGAAGLGNIRRPLDAPILKELAIEPASIVKALELSESGQDAAKEAIQRRLGTALTRR